MTHNFRSGPNRWCKISPTSLEALALLHTHRFDTLLTGDTHGVRVPECTHYLQLWRSIVDKAGRENADFTAEEIREVLDAWDSGDYELYFTV